MLPLSRSLDLPEHHGTRHRAALGLTEVCDAVVVCVSEERAAVSVAADETLREVHSAEELGRRLDALCRRTRRADSLDDRAGRSPKRTRRDVLAYALIAAGVVTSWYTMAGSRFHVVARQVPIEFRNLSENLALEPPSDDKVLVELRGPSHLLESLQDGSLSAFVDLSEAKAGVQEVPVEGNAPSGVHVVSVVPSEIRIEVLERRSIPVRAAAGSLFPSDMEVVAVTPERVQVVGTPGAFADIEAIATEPITSRDIDGKVARVKLRVPSGLRLVDQRKQDAVVLLRRTSPPEEPPEL